MSCRGGSHLPLHWDLQQPNGSGQRRLSSLGLSSGVASLGPHHSEQNFTCLAGKTLEVLTRLPRHQILKPFAGRMALLWGLRSWAVIRRNPGDLPEAFISRRFFIPNERSGGSRSLKSWELRALANAQTRHLCLRRH
ncbi:hypothetical protein HJG60_009305 [Phyllostomus discolor]|uniref:Uncharacterized protein n=1 Tax=Phyllostomus discolor TaxID=89673 RepID=A0A833YI94_9CHIR|nr:hypothetical protein HJG60_009305 [Phyllostomus discolor]